MGGRGEPRLCVVCSARGGKSSDREVHDQELELAAGAWAGAGECREPVSTTAPAAPPDSALSFPVDGMGRGQRAWMFRKWVWMRVKPRFTCL